MIATRALSVGATLRDSGNDIRQMLREQGVMAPEPEIGQDPAYVTALWAVAHGGLSVGEFSAVFYSYLPPWDQLSRIETIVLRLPDSRRERLIALATGHAGHLMRVLAGRR